MGKYSEAFVAFDVAKKKHAVAIAEGGRVEPGLHLVEHALVLPALQAFDLVGRASRLERAG